MQVRVLYLSIYIISGILQPIIIQILNNNGACERSTMLFMLPNCIGASFAILFNWKAFKQGEFNWRYITALCLVDTFSQVCVSVGLIFAGSMLFSILYSACTFWTAIFSRIVLGKKLQRLQWIGVISVCLGLSIGVNGSIAEIDGDVTYGAMLIIVGSMLHSLIYILAEIVLSKSNNPIAPEMLSTVMGVFGVLVCGLWQIIYTAPNFQRVVIEEVILHQGNSAVIIFAYIFLTIVDLIHALSFFHLIDLIGATTTGLLKSIQSVSIFIVSHFAFCSTQKSQCFSFGKGAAVATVVVGVICYSCRLEDLLCLTKRSGHEPHSSSLILANSRLIKIV